MALNRASEYHGVAPDGSRTPSGCLLILGSDQGREARPLATFSCPSGAMRKTRYHL
jgi:hypothetical protein